jgi:2-polyprenyl-6-methoxyphenol hydroxylase-like FAD-dependent oxidoreductase
MRPDLELALREQVTDRVDVRYGASVVGVTQSPQRVHVRLTDGSEPDVDLLVGADGIHSRVRQEVMGEEGRFLRYLGLHTAAWTFEDPAVQAALGRRWWLTDTVDRMMGLYALRDGRVAVLTVHRSADARRPDDVRAALRRRFAGMGWLVPRALEMCPPAEDVYYDQVAQVEVPRWSGGRVTLVGDACQAVSLLAGQGASLAAAGSYVLGERLATAASVEDALAEYEAAWRPVVEATQRTGRSGLEWFLPSSPARRRLRRLTFAAAALPGLNALLRRTLVGSTGVTLDELTAGRPTAAAPQ